MKQRSHHTLAGFTLIELMIVVVLLTFLIASAYSTFMTGQSLWFRVDHSIELEDNMRKAFDRIIPELSMSGHNKSRVFQVKISNGTGVNGSDVLQFSIPVICQNNGNPVDAEGNTAHWGATLTWGCSQASCMDADVNCDTAEYKYTEYLINDHKDLVRRVLDLGQSSVREDVVASNIIDLQAEVNSNQRIIKLTLTAGQDKNKSSSKMNIYLRNSR